MPANRPIPTEVLLVMAAAITAGAVLLLVLASSELLWRWTVRRRLRRFAGGRRRGEVREAPSAWAIVAILGELLFRVLGGFGATLRRQAVLALERAGEPAGMTPEHLMGFRLMGAGFGLILAVLVITLLRGQPLALVLGGLILLLSTLGLDGWLLGRASARRAAIERELPALVDMVALCLGAGMGFDAALGAITERMDGPLAEEIRRFLRAMSELGHGRRQALEAMARRVGSSDIDHFVETVIDSLETGSGLLTAITSQAVLLRQMRRRRAEASAQRAPIRMIIPMTLFVLPVLMLMIMGPVALRLVRVLAR